MTPQTSLAATERQVPRLRSLAPQYSDDDHGMYVDILNAALRDEPGIRNIALTGAYGTGKSSILQRVVELNRDEVVEVSLSTLGAEPKDSGAAEDSNPAAATKTNRIQKEIVKQLLYQQLPSDVPESRFRRIAHFPRTRVMQASLGASLLLVTFVALTGLGNPVLTDVLGVELGAPPPWLLVTGAYAAATAVLAAVFYLVRRLLHQRFQLEKVTAGPATITLPPRSASYFDEYLDEIIYFFETNSRRDIVILEDLDRFDDPHIFESLRALNNLLNTAKQLEGRTIRFVYALRDSIFEKLGHNTALAGTDQAKAEIVRSNRTKFFDLVVPVAPFINHKNARDLMVTLLEERGFVISRDLIDVAARHTADMRLIHNIVNEFAVFKARVLDVPDPAPDLTPDRLFAMMLFKNSHLADFEAIRIGESSLDKLFGRWRDTIESNMQRLRAEADTIEARIARNAAADEYAAVLAGKAEAVVERIAQIAQRNNLRFDRRLTAGGVFVTQADMSTATFWRGLIADDRPLAMSRVRDVYGNERADLTITVDDLRAMTGDPIDFDAHAAATTARDESRRAQIPREIHFLRYCDWQTLARDERYRFALPDESSLRSFQEWADHLLPSPLARDLVTRGYITPYFALHAATFYGTVMSKEALTYLMRYIDHGLAGTDIPLSGEDVDALLKDQGDDLIAERSVLNVSIIDHLLRDGSPHADAIAQRIATWGDAERAFTALYLRDGAQKFDLVTRLTPRVGTIFEFLVENATSDASDLVDAALVSWTTRDAHLPSEAVRSWLERSYHHLGSLRPGATHDHAAKAVRMIGHHAAVLADVTDLSAQARSALRKVPAYTITAANLVAVAGTEDLSLDSLRAVDPAIATHAVQHLPEYLAVYRVGADTRWTTGDAERFLQLISMTAGQYQEATADLIRGASRACRVPDLTAAPEQLWSTLVEDLRVPPTCANVWAYVDRQDDVDPALAVLLTDSGEITDIGEDAGVRTQLAITILLAGDVLPDPALRVRLAASLRPDTIPADELILDRTDARATPSPDRLIGLLLQTRLIDDDASTFQEALMTSWETAEFAIRHSQNYASFVGPATLRREYVTRLLASEHVPSEVKDAVVARLVDFVNAFPSTAEPIARHAVSSGNPMDAAQIRALAGKAADTTVTEALANNDGSLTDDEVVEILGLLGDDYPQLTTRGRDQPQITNTNANHLVLDRMKRLGIVSSVKVESTRIRVHKLH